ncbi:MAG TPA: hypothetical protein VF145_07765 [Chitinophagaceae bacterium]
MKKTLTLALVLLSLQAFSQPTSWSMNPVKDDMKDFMKQLYQYASFRNGFVVFPDSTFAQLKLNYHRFSDEVHFIGTKGDTLTLKDPKSVWYALIGRDTFFYYRNGFIQKITSYPRLNLGVKSVVQYIGKEQKGLYDTYTSVGSIDNVNDFSMDNQRSVMFTEDANYKFRSRDFFFFIDSSNRFLPVKKSTLLELLPADAAAITAYIDSNKIDFDKQHHLLQLMWFINNL